MVDPLPCCLDHAMAALAAVGRPTGCGPQTVCGRNRRSPALETRRSCLQCVILSTSQGAYGFKTGTKLCPLGAQRPSTFLSPFSAFEAGDKGGELRLLTGPRLLRTKRI